jgi:RNA polymerase-binding transcription factor DksA
MPLGPLPAGGGPLRVVAADYSGRMRADIDELLAEREARLQSELAELTKPTGEIGSISFGKRVGEGTSMAVDRLTGVAAQEQLLAMLKDIRRARQRIADGTYGACEVCGKPIPDERLEARPWAVRCVEHS